MSGERKMGLVAVRGARLYGPSDRGRADILMGLGRILAVGPDLDLAAWSKVLGPVSEQDGSPYAAIPGLVDQHLHFLGAGGADGPGSRIEEISAQSILASGVTTAVGLLGLDHVTRNLASLLGKARSLEAAGLSTFIYTGSFVVPGPTLTGSVRSDLVLIDKVIGTKVAIEDAASSNPSREDLARLASDTFAGGSLGAKAGVLHIHLGPRSRPYRLLSQVLRTSRVPSEHLVVAHVNYSEALLEGAIAFASEGTYLSVDSTLDPALGRVGAVPPATAITRLRDAGVPADRILLQSDGNGSKAGLTGTLLTTVRALVTDLGASPDDALACVTVNAAAALRLGDRKGAIDPGMDGDVVLIDDEFRPHVVFTGGIRRV